MTMRRVALFGGVLAAVAAIAGGMTTAGPSGGKPEVSVQADSGWQSPVARAAAPGRL
ncbi:hypothetical protein ACFWBF_18305 [Streptomyces sp. NPDC060028]|uniref:hypothetical protein n=1 Tax=Streptomyces sp. NPDC060028 TaxID=3347041 RepID=UPI0036796BFA